MKMLYWTEMAWDTNFYSMVMISPYTFHSRGHVKRSTNEKYHDSYKVIISEYKIQINALQMEILHYELNLIT